MSTATETELQAAPETTAAPTSKSLPNPKPYRTASDLYHWYDEDFCWDLMDEIGEAASNVYDAAAPRIRGVEDYPYWGLAGAYDNLPLPGRDGKLDAFEAAVREAGGVIAYRGGSEGEARDIYPHRWLGRPDGDGWTVYYFIAGLSVREIKPLLEAHLGPIDEPFSAARAA